MLFQILTMKRTNSLMILICSMTLLLGSCSNANRFKIDTSRNRIEVKIHRFDKDLLSLDTTNMKPGITGLYTRYHDFLPVFTNDILDTSPADTVAVSHLFHQFLTEPSFKAVNKKALQTFTNVSDIEKQVSDAFTYIHYYFPGFRLPDIYFFVSGFNRPVMMHPKFIGVGTDYYLGSNYTAYKDLTYQYMTYNMRRECVATDLVSTTLFRMFALNGTETKLLDNMLFRGKIMYLLSVVMPQEKPENLMGYTQAQWKWCSENEKQVWGYLIDQKHLFSTDVQLIRKYMNDAPFTTPISQDSPGRLGTWMGWQIVESYMKNNPKITLPELMKETNYQKMLEDSGYRP